MNLTQKINLSKEIWLSLNELQNYVPGYMVMLNLNPAFIYEDESRTKTQIGRDLTEYINNYSNAISVLRILKSNLVI
jgi:hypothetical protein